jgi:protein-tyrosine phosphatase
MPAVLFVCTGNICRSPTAEGVFRAVVEENGMTGAVTVDSAGTGGWHVGEPPDPRSCEAALRRGVDITGQRARQVRKDDFDRFDIIVALDESHLRQLELMRRDGHPNRPRLFLDFAPALGLRDVPDPYYGGPDGFENVLDMIEAASAGLLAEIRANHP